MLKAADGMPEADYKFKPTPEIRTFARVVNHISEAQLRSCGAANDTALDALGKVPAETAGKAAIVAALKASYAERDKAYAGLTDASLTGMLEVGKAKRPRVGPPWGNVATCNDQY